MEETTLVLIKPGGYEPGRRYPVLVYFYRFFSQRLHEFLGFDGAIESEKWDFAYLTDAIKPGAPLREPRPLYTKLDPGLVEEETARLGLQAA